MKTFRLISRTNVFTVTKFYTMLGGSIECVEGVTEIRGKRYLTRARLADVVKLS
jgi:hypothetical protein